VIVNKRQLASVFGVSEETITQWMKAGMPVRTQRKGTRGNEYETADCIRWYVARDSGGDRALDLTQERARLAKAQADKTELEAAELRGDLARYEDISSHWTRQSTACKSRLLVIPSKVAPRVRAAATDMDAASIIQSEICEALEELSGDGVPERVNQRRARSAARDAAAGRSQSK
jgi:phage terminase Nu1 subunit (DNA packaging protein)